MLLRSRPRRLVLGMAATGGLMMPAAAGAATSSTTSTNWAGYAATGKTFTRVSGSWVQPAVDCATVATSYSATWVGLGGYASTSTALEQIGTEADCDHGTATYSSWYELVPEAARTLTLKIRPGDQISASVTVAGSTVRMRLSNETTGRSVTKVRTTSTLDLSAAEWIQETPSACSSNGSACSVLPLADFDAVTFRNASATTRAGHKGAITDRAWKTTAINLIEAGSNLGGRLPSGPRADVVNTTSGATTGALDATGTSFTVDYASDLSVQASRLRRTMRATAAPAARF